MDEKYLLPRLKSLSELMYGAKTFAYVNKKGKYVFGTEKQKSIVTKAIAIYICINKLHPEQKEKLSKRKRIKRKRKDG